jgi:hypothetical protein
MITKAADNGFGEIKDCWVVVNHYLSKELKGIPCWVELGLYTNQAHADTGERPYKKNRFKLTRADVLGIYADNSDCIEVLLENYITNNTDFLTT